MRREITVGSVSWIDANPNPVWTSAQAGALSPDWVPKTYLGLAATKNDPPPTSLPDFKAYQGAKDFRALTYCRFLLDADDATGKVNEFRVLDAAHDGGWTPFFKLRRWPLAGASFDGDVLFNWKAAQGEASPLSVVSTQGRHPHSALAGVGMNETVLVNALIKFRAGKHTDDVGINDVGSPFHVPWVWCETLLTFSAGRLTLYGQGAAFPSHAWYLDGARVATVAQAGDAAFPLLWTKSVRLGPIWSVPVPTGPTIDLASLKIYPTLSVGAPASGPQTARADEAARTGPVYTHPNTVKGGTRVQSP